MSTTITTNTDTTTKVEKIEKIINRIDGASTLERKVRILGSELYGWRVSVTSGTWEPGEIRVTETHESRFMDDVRCIQLNINDLEKVRDILETFVDMDSAIIRAAKKVSVDERLDVALKFLKPTDWASAIKRWRRLHHWVQKWYPKYPETGWDWKAEFPRNFLNWGCRRFLGNIAPSKVFRDYIGKDVISIGESGFATWKEGSGLASEYCFRTESERYESFGFSGAMKIAINEVFSGSKKSPVGNYTKVPEQWEVDAHYFQKVVELNPKKK